MTDNAHLKNTTFQVDTAATCSTIHMNDLERIVDICDPEFGIQHTDTTINTCNDATVNLAGVIDLVCMRNKNCFVLQFYVLDGPEFRNKPPLTCGTDFLLPVKYCKNGCRLDPFNMCHTLYTQGDSTHRDMCQKYLQ